MKTFWMAFGPHRCRCAKIHGSEERRCDAPSPRALHVESILVGSSGQPRDSDAPSVWNRQRCRCWLMRIPNIGGHNLKGGCCFPPLYRKRHVIRQAKRRLNLKCCIAGMLLRGVGTSSHLLASNHDEQWIVDLIDSAETLLPALISR